jgi:hypothetical protein
MMVMVKIRNLFVMMVTVIGALLLLPSVMFAQDVTAESPVLELTLAQLLIGSVALIALLVGIVALVRQGARGERSWQQVDVLMQQQLDLARENRQLMALVEGGANSLPPRMRGQTHAWIKAAQPLADATPWGWDGAAVRLADEVFDGVPLAQKIKQLEAKIDLLASRLPDASPPAVG